MISDHQYELFLKTITEELDGDWLLIGGSLLSLLKVSDRITSDIDLCPIDEMTNDKRLNLMEIAQKCGLGVEAINPSADFFLRSIPNWKNAIVLYLVGKKGKIFRPSLDLYFKLKLNRRSESDIEDCFKYLQWNFSQKINYNKTEIINLVQNSIQNESNEFKKNKLEELKSKI